jgi:hypothetical protein
MKNHKTLRLNKKTVFIYSRRTQNAVGMQTDPTTSLTVTATVTDTHTK